MPPTNAPVSSPPVPTPDKQQHDQEIHVPTDHIKVSDHIVSGNVCKKDEVMDAPIFDKTPKSNAPTTDKPAASELTPDINSEGQKSVTHDTPVSGAPQFDKTPLTDATTDLVARDSSSKAAVAEPPHVSREDCARNLLKFILSGKLDPSMSIINFGGFGGSVLDVVQSFGPNKCLENTFMQGFIDCIREDDVLYNPDSVINTLILNVNVGTVLNIEEFEQHSSNPQPFSTSLLKEQLEPMLPLDEVLNQIKLILVPMLRRSHWTLYAINFERRRIDILGSNPYGTLLGGTTWKQIHNDQMMINGTKIPWSRLIMRRLSIALHEARPDSTVPKFGNYKIGLLPNCPTMTPGSNDCGFFVANFLRYYDFDDGYLSEFYTPDEPLDQRAFVLHYLTFHRNNRVAPLPAELLPFKYAPRRHRCLKAKT